MTTPRISRTKIVVQQVKPHIVPTAPVGRGGVPGAATQSVWLAGCGGTGSILAEHLARMIAGYRLKCLLFLIDGDAVEEANLSRQQFLPEELGHNKAVALATRLASTLGVSVSAVPHPLGLLSREFPVCSDEDDMPTTAPGSRMACTLLITATDSLYSRRIAAEMGPGLTDMGRWRYWLDVGNAATTGQAILGTCHDRDVLTAVAGHFGHETYCPVLPDAAAVNPYMMRAKPGRTGASCATLPFSEQGFGVNAAAALAAAMLAKQILVDGQVKTAQIWFDVAAGRMLPKTVTRELFAPWAAVGKTATEAQRTQKKAKARR